MSDSWMFGESLPHYDCEGLPITMRRSCELRMQPGYTHISRTTVSDLADPTKTYDVSTVWLGADHSFGDGPPLIFETMVFDDGSTELAADRYATEFSAREGHISMVVTLAATLTDPLVMDTEEE